MSAGSTHDAPQPPAPHRVVKEAQLQAVAVRLDGGDVLRRARHIGDHDRVVRLGRQLELSDGQPEHIDLIARQRTRAVSQPVPVSLPGAAVQDAARTLYVPRCP